MFDHYRMENELTEMFAREIDLINRKAVEENPNSICRNEFSTAQR
jgi:predicted nucleotidyltransferase